MEVQLSHQPDGLRWKLTRSGVFTVKSMYIDIINSNSIPTSKFVWAVKVPLKIKVFMWFIHKQVILTKDNLIKRNWTGPTRCSFCDRDETIKHLFFDARWPKFFGGRSILLLILLHGLLSTHYLGHGLMGLSLT